MALKEIGRMVGREEGDPLLKRLDNIYWIRSEGKKRI